METIETTVSSTSFLLNFLDLKSRMKEPLPTDDIVFQCRTCHSNVSINSFGPIILEKPLHEEMNYVLDGMLKSVKENHTKQSDCGLADIKIHPVLEIPRNICVSLPGSEHSYLSDILLEGTYFEVKILVVNSDSEAIFALYQNKTHEDTVYTEFIKCNFDTILNTELEETDDISEEEWIYDDESVNTFQQMLPRMVGGGRRLREDFNYVCLWCPKEDIKKGKRGRFKELKNYRDHFKKYHHGEDGEGIPMSEFIKKLNRCEPTWFCRNCKQHYSLGNQVRHKAICHLESSDTESESEEPMKGRKRTKSYNRIENKEIAIQVDERDKSRKRNEIRSREDIAKTSGKEFINKRDQIVSETSKVNSESDTDSENQVSMQSISQRESERNIAGVQTEGHTKSNIQDSQQVVIRFPRSCNKITSKDAQKVQDEDFVFDNSINVETVNQKDYKSSHPYEDVHDELYLSSEEEESAEGNIEIKIELTAEDDDSPTPVSKTKLVKWWDNIPRHIYSDLGKGGPKILLPSDSEEFVKTVTENYKNHMIEKSNLDEQMLLLEGGDAKFNQFSTDRDQPFVDKYKNFVISMTAKDVLNFFSDDYKELGLPQVAKASTAMQYTNRIMEFFRYLANVYKNFHFDWMLDFKNKIEKNAPNGEVSHDIFLPTKQDVTDFIQQYKYGSNPAANCGLRIFALKKLMDFLSKEIKDNEQEFEGSLIDKSLKVQCLLQKLKNLNSGICPDGTIKHLSTAANKSHKRTLVEQLTKCPERSISTIMKGVSDYIESDEYNKEKTKLMELAYKKTRIPSTNEYVNSTNWLLEMLVCIGGNRPCALLGITLRDWDERKPGFCPFNQNEDNDLEEEDPENDKRKVLRNPYSRPKGSSDDEPTGVIVKSETDKITVGPPCYIWFPNALVDLVKAHALLTEKVLPRSVDIYHPKTLLFMNSNGKQLKTIECRHLKNFIGLPIVAYDFRRSLSTFILDSKDKNVRQQESAVLRHKETTGYAYYYQKHSETIEYVSIQYAMKHDLVKASPDSIDNYCEKLRKDAADQEWELSQKRVDKSLEYSQQIIQKKKKSLKDARKKNARNWILPSEYDCFVEGIEEAIRIEEQNFRNGQTGPFSQLLKYKPGAERAGVFPPTGIWFQDMFRVLYGLKGEKGDEMRKAELSVYDGVPFSFSGRKKIKSVNEKGGSSVKDDDVIVANYWRQKIKNEAKNRLKGRWLPLRFIFTEKDLEYQDEYMRRTIKDE